MSNPMKRQKSSGAQIVKKQETKVCIKKQKGWLSNYFNKTENTLALSVSAQASANNSFVIYLILQVFA